MENYKEIFNYQAFGPNLELKVKVLVDSNINVDLDNNAFNEVRKLCNNLPNEIIAAHMSIDPHIQERKINQKKEIIELFNNPIFVEEIPNEYCSNYCCRQLPWFIITTKIGRFKIGWRKRVINIDWSDTICNKSAEDLFPEINNTKGDKYIHAWSLEEAKEFINKIMEN